MFDTGNILYCKNFQFNNGMQPKDKYFIVLKRQEDKLIIGSLPTRTNRVPSFIESSQHGCVNKDDRCFNCYLFQPNIPVCENGFCFDLPTFVYGDQIETYDAQTVEANYQLGVSYVLAGILNTNEFNALINCFTNSNSVKNKTKKGV